jgi:sterol desaturase/sphingolipid hydroxylase (fatty acid hydroxylase superfamily)
MSKCAKRGGYRPEKPIQIAPPFQWPLQPLAVFKWLFGFPGFLWPWLAFFIGLSIVSWLFLTPEIDRMKSFSVDWIALLFVRNFAVLIAFVGVWHARLYVQKSQGTDYKYDSRWPAVDNPTFLFRKQVWDNFFWTACSAVPIWTAYEAFTFWLHANGFATTVSWQTQPIYCGVLLLLFTPVWIDIHFYATHRFLHWKPLYRVAHYVHHKNVNVGPWSGVAMHPIEHLVYFSPVILYWFIPAHPLHWVFCLLILALGPVLGHHGFDRLVLGKKISFDTEHYMHYLHHKYLTVNYGSTVAGLPLDKWLGTFHDGSDEATEALKRRVRERAAGSSRSLWS